VQEAILVDVGNRMEDVNAVIFHELEDNHRCQKMDAEVAIGSSTKPDHSCRGNFLSIDLLCYRNAGVQSIL
jgi:hypothetical protein